MDWNGLLVVDKPQGMTSAEVVFRIKKKLPKGTKIGHAGTLDPNVTGVLPLAIGSATKAFAFLDATKKQYIAKMQLGIATDTQDIWGTVLQEAPVPALDMSDVNRVLTQLLGDYWQTPPMYSAKKKSGKKLYELARKGIEVEREAELRSLYAFTGVSLEQNVLSFTVTCSRGTYIRTLCTDIAKALGTIGTMSALRRTVTANFTEEMAVPLAAIEAAEEIVSLLRPVYTMFEALPAIRVDEKHGFYLRNGVKVNLQRFTKVKYPPQTRLRVMVEDKASDLGFIGIAKVDTDGIWFQQWLGK